MRKEVNFKKIDEFAFNGCNNLTTISIPSSVTIIEQHAISQCANLQTVVFETNSQLGSIGSQAFYECSSLTSITIPASVTSIVGSAFDGCSQLEEVTFVASSNSIELDEGIFDDCDSLTTINLNRPTSSNKTIGNRHEEIEGGGSWSIDCYYKLNGSGSYTTWQGQGVYTKIA